MTAEDTEMSPADIESFMLPNFGYKMPVELGRCMDMIKRQAEISFKAGQESGCYAEGWANGIKEVVAWVDEHLGVCDYPPWLAQLKEWGIK